MTESERKFHLEQLKAAIEVKSLTDQELVEACKAGSREAWDEFFTRLLPEMRGAIVRVLRKHAGKYIFIPKDDDTVWDIHEKIVIKLYKQGGLFECRDTTGIRPWLRTVSANQARDWLKGLKTDENLPERDAEKGMISLNAPISEDSETTYGDMFEEHGTNCEGEAGSAESILIELEGVNLTDLLLRELLKMTDRKKYWILRLAILAEDPLTSDEIEDLVRYSPLPEYDVKEKVRKITAEVDEKRELREVDLGRAVLYYHQQIRMEIKMHYAKNDDSVKGIKLVEELKVGIATKSRQRADILKKTSRLPRPSNRDIAELVGLPKTQEGQITTMLLRLQEKIVEGWEKVNKDVKENGKTDIDMKDYLKL